MKLIARAGQVPDQRKVTKVTGEKVYTLRTKVPIYGKHREMLQEEGFVFLVDPEAGYLEKVPVDKEVAVELFDFEIQALRSSGIL